MKSNFWNRWGLYLILIGVCLVFGLLIPYAIREQDPSAQTPLIMGSNALMGLVCGSFLIGLFNIFIYKSWGKRFWNINAVIAMGAGSVILYFLFKIMSL